jgi:hypothetical protein
MAFPSLVAVVALMLLASEGCTHAGLRGAFHESAPKGGGAPTKVLAVYEPWFGHPRHINVGYSSQDPVTLKKQIDEAKKLGISGFVVDWYGDREPFIDKAYGLLQSLAAGQNFSVAMMYDETDQEAGPATDDALVAFDSFHDKYLTPGTGGSQAYLTYKGRPVIFIFPKANHTDWNRVRTEVNKWSTPPLLIFEYRKSPYTSDFDGFYAWINPGQKGWAPDGSHWGEDYLRDYYQTMQSKYPDKIPVGAAWAGFDDRKASWGLSRFISQRCGKTLSDTMKISREYYPADDPIPFLVIATWNDYEEGTALERGSSKCDGGSASHSSAE